MTDTSSPSPAPTTSETGLFRPPRGSRAAAALATLVVVTAACTPDDQAIAIEAPGTVTVTITGPSTTTTTATTTVSRETTIDAAPDGSREPAAGPTAPAGRTIPDVVASAPTSVPRAATDVSAGQRNAARSAEQYLAISGFSRSGLIEQLQYEGYSAADATGAVDSLTVNWNEQASRSARQYLDISGFSHSGLIEQLQYDGYSADQAAHGATAAGL